MGSQYPQWTIYLQTIAKNICHHIFQTIDAGRIWKDNLTNNMDYEMSLKK